MPEAASTHREPVVLQDFEGSDFGDWKVEGTAFGDAPTTGNLPTQSGVENWEGRGFAASFRERDSSTGKLTSPPFTIDRHFINFIIGGGSEGEPVGIRLLINGREVRRAAGKKREKMEWKSWNVKEFEGKVGQIEIYDQHTGPWGHIQVDHFELADTRRVGEGPADFDEFPDVGTLAWLVAEAVLDEKDASDILSAFDTATSGISASHEEQTSSFQDSLTKGLATVPLELPPGAKHTITHILAWHFPNTIEPSREAGHYYAARFPNADAVVDYTLENQERLINDTFNWRDTYYDSTLPWWLLERIHLTSCCLATGTTMWWKNGRFWGYEGVVCCVGTCTHVYNYVQTVSRLFPELERNIREQQDLKAGVGLEESGLVGYRHNGRYAADGQCGTVLKVYREHIMSADDSFLQRNWEATKKVLDYAISRDGNGDGIIEDSQHNTYDVNFFGANTFVGGLYLAALRAGEEMARELGDTMYADKLHGIFESGRKYSEANLWNGEYFIQDVDLDKHKEHQYGDGCLSDQLFGQNWAHQVNLGYVYEPAKVRKALQSVWEYNWAPDLGVYNAVYPPQRLFAEAQEAGLFNCTWPKSDHLAEGVLYRDEVWTGVEYQVANHMIYEGLITEALAICRAVHDRYDPEKRNPFNEIECSDFYVRAMASWGIILALSGFVYHGPRSHIAFNPRISPENFRCVFNCAEGWGSFQQKDNDSGREWQISVKHGSLKVQTLEVVTTNRAGTLNVEMGGSKIEFTSTQEEDKLTLTFDEILTLNQGQQLTVRNVSRPA